MLLDDSAGHLFECRPVGNIDAHPLGTTAALRNRMLDFQGLNRAIGTPQMLELGKRYEE